MGTVIVQVGLLVSPYAHEKGSIAPITTQIDMVRTIEQILGTTTGP